MCPAAAFLGLRPYRPRIATRRSPRAPLAGQKTMQTPGSKACKEESVQLAKDSAMSYGKGSIQHPVVLSTVSKYGTDPRSKCEEESVASIRIYVFILVFPLILIFFLVSTLMSFIRLLLLELAKCFLA